MSKEMPLGKDLNLKFDVLENTGTVLLVRYEAENVSGANLYLFNLLYHEYNENNVFELDTNLVYITTQGDTVRLFKGVPDIPDNVFVEMPIVPCVTLLPGGQSLNETFQIDLPIRQFDPYIPDERPVIENPKEIVFSLGYFPVAEIGQRPVNNVNTTMGQALYAYVMAQDQLVVSSAPVPLVAGEVKPQGQRHCPKCGADQLPDSRFCSQCGSPL